MPAAEDVCKGRSRSYSDTMVVHSDVDESCGSTLDSDCESLKFTHSRGRSTSAGSSTPGDSTPSHSSETGFGNSDLAYLESSLEQYAAQQTEVAPLMPPGNLAAAQPQPKLVAPIAGCCWVPVAIPQWTAVSQMRSPVDDEPAKKQEKRDRTNKKRKSSPKPTRGANISSHQWPRQTGKLSNEAPLESRTTLMLRNLPSCFTRATVLKMLDQRGLAGLYNFVYLPIDFLSGAGLGYAFVNMVTSEDAEFAIQRLNGFDGWKGSTSNKVLDVCWSDPHQGIDMLIERYRNSRVMHSTVQDDYKPVLFSRGVRVPFPAPTKRVRPPFSTRSPGDQ